CNEKESNRTQSQNRRCEEVQDRDDRHTDGAFHTLTFPPALRIAQEAVSHHSYRFRASGVTIGSLVQRDSFLNRDLDGCGASSSNSLVVSCSVYRRYDNSRAAHSPSLGRRGLRGHPNCGSHGDSSRRLGPERRLPAVLQQTRRIRLPQGQRSEIARLYIDVDDAYSVASGPRFLHFPIL